MRILAVADLHYSLRQFDWLGENVERYDLLVIAGDLLDLGSSVDLDTQEMVVGRYLRRFSSRRTLLLSSGNHDIHETLEDGERAALWMEELKGPAIQSDYTSYMKGGVLFSICPWWDGPDTRDKVERLLAEDAAKPKDLWIWLHHGPPADTPVAWTGHDDAGDPVVHQWIRKLQPDFIFSGHIHNAPFYAKGSWHSRIGRTWIFNAGKQPGAIPTHIVLDLASRRAEWFSTEDFDSIEV